MTNVGLCPKEKKSIATILLLWLNLFLTQIQCHLLSGLGSEYEAHVEPIYLMT